MYYCKHKAPSKTAAVTFTTLELKKQQFEPSKWYHVIITHVPTQKPGLLRKREGELRAYVNGVCRETFNAPVFAHARQTVCIADCLGV